MKKVIVSYDEEGMIFASRAGRLMEEWLEEMELDTDNKQYVVTVEIEEVK